VTEKCSSLPPPFKKDGYLCLKGKQEREQADYPSISLAYPPQNLSKLWFHFVFLKYDNSQNHLYFLIKEQQQNKKTPGRH